MYFSDYPRCISPVLPVSGLYLTIYIWYPPVPVSVYLSISSHFMPQISTESHCLCHCMSSCQLYLYIYIAVCSCISSYIPLYLTVSHRPSKTRFGIWYGYGQKYIPRGGGCLLCAIYYVIYCYVVRASFRVCSAPLPLSLPLSYLPVPLLATATFAIASDVVCNV